MKVSAAQLEALRWLKTNGGLTVPNMNMHGKAREWPTRATLNALIVRKLIDFEQGQYDWTVRVNDAGEALL